MPSSSSAPRLCGARIGGVARFDGELLHLVGFHGASPRRRGGDARRVPDAAQPRARSLARTVLEGAPVHIHDVLPTPTTRLKDATAKSRLPQQPCRAADPRRQRHRRDRCRREEPSSFPEKHVAAAADLRRPGGDRDRERAPVQRDPGGAGAADRDRRRSCASSASRRPTCSRCSTRSSTAAYRLLRRAASSACCSASATACRLVAMPRRQQVAERSLRRRLVPIDPQANFPSRAFASG